MPKFSVVIQAGGKSSRMGRDKGLLEFQGATLIEFILNQVEGFGDETFIISNQPADYAGFGLPVHTDVRPGFGALSGIYSALKHAKYELSMILACDMPFVNIDLQRHLLGLADGFEAVIPRIEVQEYAEPFRGVYRKSCMPAIKNRLDTDQLKVADFLDDVNVRFVDKQGIMKFDPQLRSFFNVNTPQDLVKAEEIAGCVG